MASEAKTTDRKIRRDAIIGWTLLGILLTVAMIPVLEKVPFLGIGESAVVSTSRSTTSGVTTDTVTTETKPAKTLWDLAQLVIVPVALAVAAYWLNHRDRQNEARASEQRAKSDQQIATNRLEEDTLLTYYDRMNTLILDKQLTKSGNDTPARDVAHAYTLMAFRRVNNQRKKLIFQFLKDSRLLGGMRASVEDEEDEDNKYVDPVIELHDADLQGLDLSHFWLRKAVFHNANLANSILFFANLRQADLRWVNLTQADLRGARLEGALLWVADLSGSNMGAALLAEAHLSNAVLREARLVGVIGMSADFSNSDLLKADLEGAELQEARLYRANLSGANLLKADLWKANMVEADLSGANLERAYCCHALLRNAKVTEDQLSRAYCLQGARTPDGTIYDGRFQLAGDLQHARDEGIDTEDKEAMQNWYKSGESPRRTERHALDQLNLNFSLRTLLKDREESDRLRDSRA